MTPTITRRGIVTIALALAGLTLVWIALSIGTSAQTIMATPVPETPDIDALVTLIIQILLDIVRGVLEPVAVVIGR